MSSSKPIMLTVLTQTNSNCRDALVAVVRAPNGEEFVAALMRVKGARKRIVPKEGKKWSAFTEVANAGGFGSVRITHNGEEFSVNGQMRLASEREAPEETSGAVLG